MSLPKTIMFYDGGCPLCSREIKHYRRLDSAGRIDWIDISCDASLLQAMGVTLETAMARSCIPASGWLAGDRRLCLRRGLVGTPLLPLAGPSGVWPGLLPPLERLYSRFARWRLQRRCREGVCAMPAEAIEGVVQQSQ